eukprot:scaffold30156_cov65-Phaeocystis_antarctica.AAC.10
MRQFVAKSGWCDDTDVRTNARSRASSLRQSNPDGERTMLAGLTFSSAAVLFTRRTAHLCCSPIHSKSSASSPLRSFREMRSVRRTRHPGTRTFIVRGGASFRVELAFASSQGRS